MSASGLATLDIVLQGEKFVVAADRPKVAKFWKKAEIGKWEADTFAFIRKHAGPNSIFLDIGAWIGPMSMYAGRLSSQVLSFEPDPVAFRDLKANIGLNGGDIEVVNAGVDREAGSMTLYAPSGLGQSITSSLPTDGAQAIQVPTLTFADIGKRLDGAKRVFAKVDIEGHEYKIIDDLIAFVRLHNVALHLSLHPRTFYEAARQGDNRISAIHKTWKATAALLKSLEALGAVTLTDSGRAMTAATLFQFVFLRTRVRNFAVEIVPLATVAP